MTDVAPQQLDWVAREIWKEQTKDSTLPVLPREIWAHILELTELTTLDEAKTVREELMHERKYFMRDDYEGNFKCVFPVLLCFASLCQ